jgi:hypothetical protein
MTGKLTGRRGPRAVDSKRVLARAASQREVSEVGDRASVHSLTWQRWQEIPTVCFDPRNLRATLVVAAVVGTLHFAINQLDLVLSKGAHGSG